MTVKYTRSYLQTLPNKKLINIILEQQDTIVQLENTVSQLQSTITRLENTILRMEERLHQLEGQLHKDSHNSHIPSSQSQPAPVKNLREPTGKHPGGQPGHPGHTLVMVANPQQTVTCQVTHCQKCGRSLSQTPVLSYERRQVFDIPPIQMAVTEYRVEKKLCLCGHLTTALFPREAQAPVQYGINTQTLISVLAIHGYLTEKRLSELMDYLLGYRVNEATICAILEKLYDNLAGFEARSKQELIASPVIHNDETGVPVEGEREWAHVTATTELTHYAIDPQRGQEALDRIGILPYFHGTTVHDRWQTYFLYQQCRHGCCNAHDVRETIYFEEEEKAAWARPFREQLLAGKAAVDKAKAAGQDHIDPEFWAQYSRRYDEILLGALKKLPLPVRTRKRGKVKKSPQRNFIESMLTLKEAVLRFLTDFRVPFTNNLAERDLRMFKLKGKISGAFRSTHGAERFARIRGYVSTIRKNSGNVLEEIKNALNGRPFLLQKWRMTS